MRRPQRTGPNQKRGEIGQTEQEGENVSDKDTKQHVKIAPPKAPQPKTPSAKRSKKASPKPQATAGGAVKVAAAPSGHVEEAVDILWRMIAGKDLAGGPIGWHADVKRGG